MWVTVASAARRPADLSSAKRARMSADSFQWFIPLPPDGQRYLLVKAGSSRRSLSVQILFRSPYNKESAADPYLLAPSPDQRIVWKRFHVRAAALSRAGGSTNDEEIAMQRNYRFVCSALCALVLASLAGCDSCRTRQPSVTHGVAGEDHQCGFRSQSHPAGLLLSRLAGIQRQDRAPGKAAGPGHGFRHRRGTPAGGFLRWRIRHDPGESASPAARRHQPDQHRLPGQAPPLAARGVAIRSESVV